MIKGIHRSAISTPKTSRLVDFYTKHRGFQVLRNDGRHKGADEFEDFVGLENSSTDVVMIRHGDSMIEFLQYALPVPAAGDPDRPMNDHGIPHICIYVADIESEYTRLEYAGMSPLTGLNSPPTGPNPPQPLLYLT